MLSIAKRIGRLSEPLRYWIIKASAVVDKAVSDITTLEATVSAQAAVAPNQAYVVVYQ